MNNKQIKTTLKKQARFKFPVKLGDTVKVERDTREKAAGIPGINRFKGKVVAIYPEYFVVDNGYWKQSFNRGDIVGNIWSIEVVK